MDFSAECRKRNHLPPEYAIFSVHRYPREVYRRYRTGEYTRALFWELIGCGMFPDELTEILEIVDATAFTEAAK